MKINSTLKPLVFASSLILSLTSCNRTEEANTVSSIANDDNTAENAFYDLKIAGDNAGTIATSKTQSINEKSIKDTCAKVSYINFDTVTKTGSLIVDFGDKNCPCKDGRNRRGKIGVEYTGTDKAIGSKVVYTPESYFVNDNGVSGKKTVTYSAPFTFSIKVENGTIKKSDGSGTITWNSDRIRKMITGFTTPLDFSDDIYEITGTSSGINASGNSYSFSTESPLVKAIGCQYIKSGKLKIQRSGKKDATVDYGDGTCDDKGTISVGSWTKNITLKKW